MKKKAMEISPPSLVVIIILVLLVLVVLLFIFGDQSGEFLKWIRGTGDSITTTNKCENPLFGRTCEEDGCSDGYRSEEVLPPPNEEWDCSPCYECIPEGS